MNTDAEKLKKEAWDNILICCQTLCHKDPVIDYIYYLEKKVEELENGTTK